MKRNELIFWRDVPVDVEKGAFEFVSQKWGSMVLFVCFDDYSSERRKCEWTSDGLNQIIIGNNKNINEIIKGIFTMYPNAIHVFNGFRGKFKSILNMYSTEHANLNLCIMAERPSYRSESLLEKAAKHILYKYYCRKYADKIKAFITFGRISVETYERFGFHKETLFSYMYNRTNISVPGFDDKRNTDCNNIKMIYIGRFDARYKGVDILIKAINEIQVDNWSLDFVGGYGDLLEDIMNLDRMHSHIHYRGIWNTNNVVEQLKDYDLCIIPSRNEGWNLIPSEAIYAGIGSIITKQATSDELISASGAGIVIEACNSKILADTIESILSNPEVIDVYKYCAREYSCRISNLVVGQYFIDIMDYSFGYGITKKPQCPWL